MLSKHKACVPLFLSFTGLHGGDRERNYVPYGQGVRTFVDLIHGKIHPAPHWKPTNVNSKFD